MRRAGFGLIRSALLLSALAAPDAAAHPGSGIAVTSGGTVYFTDTGCCVWRLSPGRPLERVHASNFHWLAHDPSGRWANAALDQLKTPTAEFVRVSPAGSAPVLITSSDYPLVFDAGGTMYYAPYRKGQPMHLVRARVDSPARDWVDISRGIEGLCLVD